MNDFQDNEKDSEKNLKRKGAISFGVFMLIVLIAIILTIGFFSFLILSFANYLSNR